MRIGPQAKRYNSYFLPMLAPAISLRLLYLGRRYSALIFLFGIMRMTAVPG